MPPPVAPIPSPAPSRLRRFLSVTAALLALAGRAPAQDEPPATTTDEAAAHASKPPVITRDEARALAAAELPLWRERIAAGRPRVAFTADTWKTLRARHAAAEGREKELFDAVIRRARADAAQPVQPYRPPEEWVSPKVALLSAQAELWQRDIGDELVNSSLALALVDDPDIRRKILETVLTACAYPSWGLRSRRMHLAAAHLSRGIAIAYDWHPDLWTETDKETIRSAIRYHVGDIADGLHGKAFWATSYHNNHNHVSVSALGLCGLAFLDDIPEAAEWLAGAKLNFERAIAACNADGSTLESFSYWAYALDFIVQFIEGTRHVANTDTLYRHDFLRHAIGYRIHGSTPGFKGPLPWGATGGSAGASAALYALAREYRSTEGQFLATSLPVGANPWQAPWLDPSLAATTPATLDHHANVVDIVASRTGWTTRDYLLSIKSGLNNRNHGHLDAGAIALAYGDEWLLTAPRYGQGKRDGTGDYWSRNDGRRWNYFSTTTEGHSTLLINGKNQRFDKAARGVIDLFKSEGDWCWTGVNLSEAYSDTKYIRRDVLHRRGDYILVFDEASLAAPGTVEWLAQALPPKIVAEGSSLRIAGKVGSLELRALHPRSAVFAPRAPTAKHYDLPKSRLQTYALRQEGSTARYVVALLPSPAGKHSPVHALSAEETAEGFLIAIDGEGWTDRVSVGAKTARATRAFADNRSTDSFEITRP